MLLSDFLSILLLVKILQFPELPKMPYLNWIKLRSSPDNNPPYIEMKMLWAFFYIKFLGKKQLLSDAKEM